MADVVFIRYNFVVVVVFVCVCVFDSLFFVSFYYHSVCYPDGHTNTHTHTHSTSHKFYIHLCIYLWTLSVFSVFVCCCCCFCLLPDIIFNSIYFPLSFASFHLFFVLEFDYYDVDDTNTEGYVCTYIYYYYSQKRTHSESERYHVLQCRAGVCAVLATLTVNLKTSDNFAVASIRVFCCVWMSFYVFLRFFSFSPTFRMCRFWSATYSFCGIRAHACIIFTIHMYIYIYIILFLLRTQTVNNVK